MRARTIFTLGEVALVAEVAVSLVITHWWGDRWWPPVGLVVAVVATVAVTCVVGLRRQRDERTAAQLAAMQEWNELTMMTGEEPDDDARD